MPVYTHDIHVASINVTLPYYLQGFRTAVRIGGGKALYLRYISHRTKPYGCAYYDRSTTTVQDQTFDGYCTVYVEAEVRVQLQCCVDDLASGWLTWLFGSWVWPVPWQE